MVELELAKKANSPIWKRLVKNRIEDLTSRPEQLRLKINSENKAEV